MLNNMYRLLLSLNATSWMVVVFFAKGHVSTAKIPFPISIIMLLAIPVLLTVITNYLVSFFPQENIEKCRECTLADNEFLPIYLGYFFISLSIQDFSTLIIIYAIVFVFSYISQTQYFNPIALILGYHYYHVVTERGTRIFVIKKGKIIRNVQFMEVSTLRRINDTTYISKGDNDESNNRKNTTAHQGE